jgi:prepilin-type N-terminal cleavage/methylation domain-containing protein
MALLAPGTRDSMSDRSRQGRFQSHNHGFTLVELAIVVAAIALLLGSLLVPLTTQVEQRNVAQTDTQLQQAREALLGYAMVTGRLPRPATSPTDGREKPANCSPLPSPEADCTGYLPWVTLGVSQTDAWGKMFRYSVSPEFATTTIPPTPPFNLSTSAANGKSIWTRNTSGTQILLANNVIAVVFSYGSNNFGTTVDGTAIANTSATNTDEQNNDSQFGPPPCGWTANGTHCETFWGRPVSANSGASGGEFDDRVAWISKNILFSQMVSAGKLP